MARLSDEKIQLIKETYAKVGTYTATAKIVGSSPATVKKYVMEECPVQTNPKKEPIRFDGEIPSVEDVSWIYEKSERGLITQLSDEEKKELEEFRKEL